MKRTRRRVIADPVAGQGSQYRVVNRGSHLCLDADASTTGRNGQEIQATSCDGLSAQTWQLSGGGTLVSVPGGSCLDAEASTSGQPVQRVLLRYIPDTSGSGKKYTRLDVTPPNEKVSEIVNLNGLAFTISASSGNAPDVYVDPVGYHVGSGK